MKAIEQDKFSKTHAVKSEVLILSDLLYNNMDSITFFKGTNIIRNFYNLTGPELFFKGLRAIVKKHSGGLITYNDFKEIYNNLYKERDEKVNAIEIIDPFITKNGINELSISFEYDNNEKVTKSTINQKFDLCFDNYYNYRTNLLVIFADGSEKVFLDVNVSNSPSTEIKELIGLSKPKVVLLNSEDICYFRQAFTSEEVDFLINNINVRFFI